MNTSMLKMHKFIRYNITIFASKRLNNFKNNKPIQEQIKNH